MRPFVSEDHLQDLLVEMPEDLFQMLMKQIMSRHGGSLLIIVDKPREDSGP